MKAKSYLMCKRCLRKQLLSGASSFAPGIRLDYLVHAPVSAVSLICISYADSRLGGQPKASARVLYAVSTLDVACVTSACQSEGVQPVLVSDGVVLLSDNKVCNQSIAEWKHELSLDKDPDFLHELCSTLGVYITPVSMHRLVACRNSPLTG